MRVKLSEKYKIEREEICTKLLNILNLGEDRSFLLCDLDGDVEKQTAILAMKEEIQQYFAVSSISSFKPNIDCKRPYLNVIRGILRQQGYIFNGSAYCIKLEDGISKSTIKYFIFKN